jgi:hypothetical protein
MFSCAKIEPSLLLGLLVDAYAPDRLNLTVSPSGAGLTLNNKSGLVSRVVRPAQIDLAARNRVAVSPEPAPRRPRRRNAQKSVPSARPSG